jgi:hypothetical protein
MSTRGQRAHRPEQTGPPEFAWILLVLAAALIGGLAAVPLVHASLIIAVVVAVVAAAITVLALRASSALPGGQAAYGPSRVSAPPGAPVDEGPSPGAPVYRDPPPGEAGPGTTPPGLPPADDQPGYDGHRAPWPPAPAETVVEMLPLPHQPGQEPRPGDAPWWDPAPAAAPRPSPGAKRAPAPDLTTYLASTFIAQCPRCGAFRLDIRQAKDAWDFRCEACEYTWAWRPGTAWPPVRVMPRRRRELRPPTS